MPVIINEHREGLYHLGLWNVTEDEDTLFSMLCLNDADCKRFQSFQNPARRTEWLSVRTLLKEMTGNTTGIHYNERRKPFINDHSYHISISHSNKLTSVLLSKNHRVGIDLEFMSHRIGKIAHKFMSEKEAKALDKEMEFFHLYIHWCAKEALYKICDKDGLNFKTNLIIEPFKPGEKGQIKGKVIRDDHNEDFGMHYFRLDNYIVVWCMK